MWTVRLVLLGVLAGLVLCDLCMLRRGRKHKALIENTLLNLIDVGAYNTCCYLIAALPPAGGWDRRPVWLEHQVARIAFVALGSLLIGIAIVLFVVSLRQRRVLGLQDVPAGLLTSRAYRYFRHPIYAGILLVSLGLALVTRNPDGLLMFPALLGILIAQALIEEKYDMSVRFQEQYPQYKRRVRMFGPPWLWIMIVVAILLVAGSGWRHLETDRGMDRHTPVPENHQ